MIRFCNLCLCLVVWAFPTIAQTQTLHNTVAKGTLNITGGLHIQSITGYNSKTLNNYSFEINYSFKHYYTIGFEGSSLYLTQENLQKGSTWNSENLLFGINLQRNDHLYKTQMGKFKIASILSISSGSIFSKDELTEQATISRNGFSSTGYYISGSLGLRFEFVRRLFLEVKESGGFFSKNNVNLRTKNQEQLSTNSWYVDTQIKLGIFMFINTLDKCGTCPKW